MNEELHVAAPFSEDAAGVLVVGDRVLVSGTLWTARDAAHMRMIEALGRGEDLPFPAGAPSYTTWVLRRRARAR